MAMQQQKPSGRRGYRKIWTQKNGSSQSQSCFIVCKWIKHCGGQSTSTSVATSLISWITWNWGQPMWSISINLIIYDHKVAQVTSALTWPVNSSRIAFTLSHSVRCIKENKIETESTQNVFKQLFHFFHGTDNGILYSLFVRNSLSWANLSSSLINWG